MIQLKLSKLFDFDKGQCMFEQTFTNFDNILLKDAGNAIIYE
jgi:hypothetical protein